MSAEFISAGTARRRYTARMASFRIFAVGEVVHGRVVEVEL